MIPASNGCGVCGFEVFVRVADLQSACVGLYDDARYPGRMLVSAHKHFDHLDEMPAGDLAGFMVDVQRAARALRSLPGVERVNVAVLGNRDSHVHAHVIPRRPGEPNVGRAPWDGAEPHAALTLSQRVRLILELREMLAD